MGGGAVTVLQLLDDLQAAGYTLLAAAGKISVEGPGPLPAETLAIIRDHKAEIIAEIERAATHHGVSASNPIVWTLMTGNEFDGQFEAPARRTETLQNPTSAGSPKVTSDPPPAVPLVQPRPRPFVGWQAQGGLTPTEHFAAIGGYVALAAVDRPTAYRLWDAARLWARDGPGSRWEAEYQQFWEAVT